jgi:hypothetical protein
MTDFFNLQNEDHDCPKRRFLPQNTVKFDCPAQIRLSEVIKYPDYKVKFLNYI